MECPDLTDFTITGLATTAQVLADSEQGFVTAEGTIVVTSLTAVTMAGGALVVDGSVFARGPTVLVTGPVGPIVVQEGGRITGYGSAIECTVASSTLMILNAGTLLGGYAGIYSTGTEPGLVNIINNTGVISSTSGSGVRSGSGTFTSSSLDNSGTIQGATMGVHLETTQTSGLAHIVVNTGTILGGYIGLQGSTGGDRLVSSGTIAGDLLSVEMGSGDDMLSISGTLLGQALLSAGNDQFLADLGTAGYDADGGSGRDTLRGGSGEDTLNGGSEGDLLRGNGGGDSLFGGAHRDALYGGAGDDLLYGDIGDDIASGGAGEDEISGGAGADLVRGGAGADTFVYQLASDSTFAVFDTLQDFRSGLDRIDLADVSAQKMRFMATAAFAGGGIASVRVTSALGDSTVLVDSNGDGTADMRLVLLDVATVAAGDLLL